MDDEQQIMPTDEEVERELEDAEMVFNEQTEEENTIKKVDDTPLAKDILTALGFIRYDNKEKGIAYKLHIGPLQIGRTYTEKYPIGNMWVRCLRDCEYGKKDEFLKRDECKQIPQVALFYHIRDGKLPIPAATITGKVVGKSVKAVQIQFDEFGQTETSWWGFGALKKNEEGMNYMPASYSKETEHYSPKMQVPRNIILENYEMELAEVPLTTSTDTGGHREETKEEVGNGTVADKILHKESVTFTEGEKLTVDYYVSLIGEITEKVRAEERIAEKERGYAINMVFNAVTRDRRTELIAELKNGGSHEE